MAFIGLEIPHSTARVFGDIEVPGDRTDSAFMHVTLIYMGSEVSIDDLAEAVKATYSVTATTKPFTVRSSRVMSFPINPDDEDGHPIIARIESDDLHALRNGLTAAFDEAGIQYSKKFPEYKPHATLAYGPDEVEEFTIPTIEWGAHEIVMWGGDEGDRKLTVTFPLTFSPALTAMALRVASRFTCAGVAPRRARPTGY